MFAMTQVGYEPPQTLAEKAYDVIEDLIATLKLAPGSVFSETELSKEIKIGRTPLREALLRMSREHLIIMMPRRGVRVTDIKITDQLALLDARRAIDRLIAQRAAERASPGQRARLKEIAGEIIDAAEEGRLEEFMKLDGEFDRIAEDASRNPYAVQAVAPLHALCRRFWYKYKRRWDTTKSARLHAEIMRAIARANAEAAGKASDKLLDYMEEFTRAAMDLY